MSQFPIEKDEDDYRITGYHRKIGSERTRTNSNNNNRPRKIKKQHEVLDTKCALIDNIFLF